MPRSEEENSLRQRIVNILILITFLIARTNRLQAKMDRNYIELRSTLRVPLLN
jgi:hypothetical protein